MFGHRQAPQGDLERIRGSAALDVLCVPIPELVAVVDQLRYESRLPQDFAARRLGDLSYSPRPRRHAARP
eukprot:12046855-Alexandrium_andersonii.AAC.1